MILQLPARRSDRLAIDRHVRFARGAAAFLEVARGAGGRDILPRRPPALGAWADMIEGQFLVAAAIDAGKAVAEEQVESGERRIFVGPDELPKRDHRGQLQRPARAVDLALIAIDHVDPLEEHRLDRGLPWPEAQRVVGQRRVIGVEDQRRAGIGMSDELGMIQRQQPFVRWSELLLPGLVALKEERAPARLPLLPAGCQPGVTCL